MVSSGCARVSGGGAAGGGAGDADSASGGGAAAAATSAAPTASAGTATAAAAAMSATSAVGAALGGHDARLRPVRRMMRVAAEHGLGDATARDMRRGALVFVALVAWEAFQVDRDVAAACGGGGESTSTSAVGGVVG